jgi:hypothetical protein
MGQEEGRSSGGEVAARITLGRRIVLFACLLFWGTRMRQWHPLFAEILRPWISAHYEVQTNVPVGDLPREADILLLRRRNVPTFPFEGTWRWLSAWNILEFKGPSVAARPLDLDGLIELGLGIARRLSQQHGKKRQRLISAEHVSFWYLANQLGSAFVSECERRLGQVLVQVEPGMWRAQLLTHPVNLVSRVDLRVERDNIPLHLVAKEPLEKELAVARFLLEHEDLWDRCGQWFGALHPAAWDEVKAMAAAKSKRFDINLGPLIEHVGVKEVIKQIGPKRLLKDVLQNVSLDELLRNLPVELRQELKRRMK